MTVERASFFDSRWVPRPARDELPTDGRAPSGRLSRRRRRRRPQGQRPAPTSGCSSATARPPSAPRASPARACRPGRCWSAASAATSTGCGPWSSTAATRTRPIGAQGYDVAARMQEQAAAGARARAAAAVAVASTGVIGVPLPMDADRAAASPQPPTRSAREGDERFAAAIQTTDAFEKRVTLDVAPAVAARAPQRPGQGRRDDLAAPSRRMLCFVETDAALAPETADLLLGVCVKRSFDRISVDGQLSTNDTVILLAERGQRRARRARDPPTSCAFGEALDALLRQLALLDRARRRGRRRVGRVVVRGGHASAVERVARAVANSPLVKTALHGGDPNWGRIAQAVGAALPGHRAAGLRRRDRGRRRCARPARRSCRRRGRARRARWPAPEVEYEVAPARRGPRDRGLLLRPLATST